MGEGKWIFEPGRSAHLRGWGRFCAMDAESGRQSNEPAHQGLPESFNLPAKEETRTAFCRCGRRHCAGKEKRIGLQCISGRLEQWHASFKKIRFPILRFFTGSAGKKDHAAGYAGHSYP